MNWFWGPKEKRWYLLDENDAEPTSHGLVTETKHGWLAVHSWKSENFSRLNRAKDWVVAQEVARRLDQ